LPANAACALSPAVLKFVETVDPVRIRLPLASSAIPMVAAGVDRRNGTSAACLCLAAASAHEFEIPPQILSTFPETEVSRDFPSSFILMAALPGSAPRAFRAKGLDAAYGFYISATAKSVTFH
jgi:hypothetical protein